MQKASRACNPHDFPADDHQKLSGTRGGARATCAGSGRRGGTPGVSRSAPACLGRYSLRDAPPLGRKRVFAASGAACVWGGSCLRRGRSAPLCLGRYSLWREVGAGLAGTLLHLGHTPVGAEMRFCGERPCVRLGAELVCRYPAGSCLGGRWGCLLLFSSSVGEMTFLTTGGVGNPEFLGVWDSCI